jgi:hypothetical protein
MTHQQVTNVRFGQGRSGRINRLVNQHFPFLHFQIFTSLRFHFRSNAVVSHNKPQLNKESQMKLPLARRVRRFTTEMIATLLQGWHFHQPNSSGLPHSKQAPNKNLYRDIELVGDSCRFMVTTKGSVTHAPLLKLGHPTVSRCRHFKKESNKNMPETSKGRKKYLSLHFGRIHLGRCRTAAINSDEL